MAMRFFQIDENVIEERFDRFQLKIIRVEEKLEDFVVRLEGQESMELLTKFRLQLFAVTRRFPEDSTNLSNDQNVVRPLIVSIAENQMERDFERFDFAIFFQQNALFVLGQFRRSRAAVRPAQRVMFQIDQLTVFRHVERRDTGSLLATPNFDQLPFWGVNDQKQSGFFRGRISTGRFFDLNKSDFCFTVAFEHSNGNAALEIVDNNSTETIRNGRDV